MATSDVGFSSTFSTYVTLLGYSLSNSDFWRFPFLVYRNGGGAFLIPYLLTIALCGMPLYFLEFSISKFSGKGPYTVWDVCPLFRGSAVTIMIAYLIFIIGTTIFRCWMIDFFLNSFQSTLPWSHCNNDWNTHGCLEYSKSKSHSNSTYNNSNSAIYWDNSLSNSTPFGETEYLDNSSSITFALRSNITMDDNVTRMSAAEEFWQFRILELSTGITDWYPIQLRYVVIMFVFRIAIFLGVIKSIKSIEKVMYITTILPLLFVLAIFIRSLMLPGALDGLKYYFYPDFNKLLHPRIWIEAFLMGFYTLGFGWGCVMTMGSHAAFKENSLRTSILLPLLDTFSAIFTGLVAFSVLGNMAVAFRVPIVEVINAGMSVGIVSYMTALTSLPFPQLWTIVFLTALLLASLDTQLVPFEMILQTIGEMYPGLFPKYRLYVLSALSVFVFVAALPTCTGEGAYLFLWADWYTGAWTGPSVSIIELIIVCWIYGIDRFSFDVSFMNGRGIPSFLRLLLAFVAPVAVMMIFCTSIVRFVPPSYGDYNYPYPAHVLGWTLVGLAASPVLYKIVVLLLQEKGTILARLGNLLKPKDSWGPRNEDVQDRYVNGNSQFKDRSAVDIFFCNLFGTYRKR